MNDSGGTDNQSSATQRNEYQVQDRVEVAEKVMSLLSPLNGQLDSKSLRQHVLQLLADNFPDIDINVGFEDHDDEGTAIAVYLPSPICGVGVVGVDGRMLPYLAGRQNMVLKKALAYAIAHIGRLPEGRREWSDCHDMVELFEAMAPNPRHREHIIAGVEWHTGVPVALPAG